MTFAKENQNKDHVSVNPFSPEQSPAESGNKFKDRDYYGAKNSNYKNSSSSSVLYKDSDEHK